MLYGGAPYLVAGTYAVIGWQMVLTGTTLAFLSAGAALRGDFFALAPLPLVIAAFSLAAQAIRGAAEAISAVRR